MVFQRVTAKLVHFQNLTLVLVVIAAYVSTFALTPKAFTALEILVMLLLGAAFVLLDLIGIDALYARNPRLAPHLYFAIQIPIAGVMLHLSQGNAWLMLMPLASQAVMFYSLRGVVLMNLLFIGLLLFNMSSLTTNWQHIGQGLVAFQTAFFFVFVFTQLMVREKRARDEVQELAGELKKANQQLREYSAKVEELAGTQERNRLAREIHDGLGHYLTALNIQVRAAAAVMEQDPDRARAALEKVETLAQDALADVRRSVAALRSESQFDRPLPEMLAALVEDCRASGLVADFRVSGLPYPLPPPVELTLFRTAQEGLTNVHKHSLASRVQLELEYHGDRVRLRVMDNGVGNQTQADLGEMVSGGFGLFGLRERVQILGGTFAIQSAPNEGFCLEVEIRVNPNGTHSHSSGR